MVYKLRSRYFISSARIMVSIKQEEQEVTFYTAAPPLHSVSRCFRFLASTASVHPGIRNFWMSGPDKVQIQKRGGHPCKINEIW